MAGVCARARGDAGRRWNQRAVTDVIECLSSRSPFSRLVCLARFQGTIGPSLADWRSHRAFSLCSGKRGAGRCSVSTSSPRHTLAVAISRPEDSSCKPGCRLRGDRVLGSYRGPLVAFCRLHFHPWISSHRRSATVCIAPVRVTSCPSRPGPASLRVLIAGPLVRSMSRRDGQMGSQVTSDPLSVPSGIWTPRLSIVSKLMWFATRYRLGRCYDCEGNGECGLLSFRLLSLSCALLSLSFVPPGRLGSRYWQWGKEEMERTLLDFDIIKRKRAKQVDLFLFPALRHHFPPLRLARQDGHCRMGKEERKGDARQGGVALRCTTSPGPPPSVNMWTTVRRMIGLSAHAMMVSAAYGF